MANEIKITELVDQATFDQLSELSDELVKLRTKYEETARELAKGLNVDVKMMGDIDKIDKLLIDKTREATETTERLNTVLNERGKILAATTNVVSRQLMEQERVNKSQREAYTEYDRVKRLLDHFHDTYDNQVVSLVKLNKELQQNKDDQSKLEKQLNTGQVSMAQYTQRMAELITQQRGLSQEKKTLTQLMTAEEKAGQEVEDSYIALSQKLELLKKAYKGLSEEGRGSEYGKELENTIQNLDAHLKDMAADLGEFQRNVGNYAIASKNGIVTTESLNVALTQEAHTVKDLTDQNKILTEARSMLDMSSADYAQTLATVNAKIDENNKKIEESGQSNSSLKKDLKEMVLEIANLTIAYQSLSEEEKNSAQGQELARHIQELIEKAGVLKDAIADTNEAISNAASDTRTFDQLSGAVQLAIDGFGLAQGAAAMLGIREEELAEIQTKLQAAIAASNAVTKIQNALQKQSALMQGVNLVQTKLRTTAEKLHTAAQGKGIIATKAATVAQWAFNAAANANPIGLIVVAIGACIGAVYGLVKAFEAFVGPNKDATEELKKGIEQVEAMEQAHEQLISSLERSGASQEMVSSIRVQCLNSELEAMERVINKAIQNEADWDEIHEAQEKRHEKELELLDNYESAYFKLCDEIVTQAREDIKEQQGEAALKRELVEEEILGQQILLEQLKAVAQARGYSIQQYEDILDALTKKRERALAAIDAEEEKKAEANRKKAADEAKKRQQDANRAAAELRKQVEAGEDALLKLITDNLERQRESETLSYNRRLRDLQQQLAKTSSTQIQLRTALCRQIEGLTAEHNRKMAELEFSGNERRLKAESDVIASHLAYVKQGTKEEYDWKLKALDTEHQMELLSLDKALANQTITVEQYEELRTNLVLKYANLRSSAEQDFATQKAKLIEQAYAGEREIQNNAYISAVNALKRRYAQELAAAKGNVAQQEAIKLKFEQDQARLSEIYAQQTARDSIAMLEEILKNEQLSTEDRLKYEQDLAKAKVDLETAMADAAIAQIERTTEADNKANEQRKANAQQWLQVAADSLNTINELVSTVYDAKIAKVEEEQETNTSAGEAEIERITELVEKKVITEEEGEARKRAAEAQTAKKTEELERKKQQLKQKQAMWDKANNLAQAGIATALAITQALPNLVLAAIAGAMGALQIATIIATPIPKYARGTDYHRGGLAVVGDGGNHEVVKMNGTTWLTPDTPTLVDLPKGASVYSSIANYEQNFAGLLKADIDKPEAPKVIVNNDYKKLEEKMDRVIFLFGKANRERAEQSTEAYIEYIKMKKGL